MHVFLGYTCLLFSFVVFVILYSKGYCIDQCIEMVRVFEYDEKGRKYVKDMKMGNRWRVKGLGKKKAPKKESELKEGEL